jgi:XTP/dITP diphosphohydrolase
MNHSICLAGFWEGTSIRVNTSNRVKLEEFRKYFGTDISIEQKDLQEPNSDPITVVRYKASQFENVLIDDTSLDIEGESVGVNIRWVLPRLKTLIGRRATFVSLLGIQSNGKVFVFKGEVSGRIVEPKGENIGFLAYFLPDGASRTLGEELLKTK